MNLLGSFQSIPAIRPKLNVGGLFDYMTCDGEFYIGIHGESIINGGLCIINSICGPGNSFKSTIIKGMNVIAAERYVPFQVSDYDTEGSGSYTRVKKIMARYPHMNAIAHDDPDLPPEQIKYRITSSADVVGDDHFEKIKELAKHKINNKKTLMLTTPFADNKGQPIKMMVPTGSIFDSISRFEASTLNEKIVDKNQVGESGMNILFMKEGIVKKQLINQMPNLATNATIFFSMVAHVGDEFELDQYAPKKHKLTFAKKGSKVTGATKAFEFINNVLYEIFNVTVLNNPTKDTGVLYPLTEEDRGPGTTDLLCITIKPTRNKHGPSGVPMDIIVSQREGMLPTLTQFHFCKENDWGIEGNDRNYAMSIYPDVSLSRTTVREKIDSDPLLQRAIEITSDLLQIQVIQMGLEPGLFCEPATLYKDLKEMGYDWNVLLNTRAYWQFEEYADQEERPFLSTIDLLRMRKGLYKPYWMK